MASYTLVYGQHRRRTPSTSGIPSCRTLFLYTHNNWAHLDLLYQYFLCLCMGTCSYFLNTRVVGKSLNTEFEFTQMYMGFFGRNGKRSWHKRHFFIMLLILLNEPVLTNYEAFFAQGNKESLRWGIEIENELLHWNTRCATTTKYYIKPSNW